MIFSDKHMYRFEAIRNSHYISKIIQEKLRRTVKNSKQKNPDNSQLGLFLFYYDLL
mgnify:CR=1 FL=1